MVAMLAIILGMSVFLWACDALKDSVEALKPHLAEYLAADKGRTLNSHKSHIVGKVVVVDLGAHDFLRLDLPAELKAMQPGDVGSVAQVTFEAEEVGTYDDGRKGYRYAAQVSIVDLAKGGVIAAKDFVGTDPPQTKPGNSGDQYGDKPYGEIVEWLKSLPVKSSR